MSEYDSWYNWYYDIPIEIVPCKNQVRLRHVLHNLIRNSKNIKNKLKRVGDDVSEGSDPPTEKVPDPSAPPTDVPDVPENVPENVPEVPENVPDVPDIPDVPDVPDIPDVPEKVPDVPEKVPDVPKITNITYQGIAKTLIHGGTSQCKKVKFKQFIPPDINIRTYSL